MRIISYNLNGIRAQLVRDYAFPAREMEAAGYQAVWHGQKGFNGVALLARTADGGPGPTLRRMGLPGDPDDTHSRYIEAEVDGLVIGSIYLPNGNPVPGEKFAYKLAWLERLRAHAAALLAEEKPTVLAGDYNVIPTATRDDVFSARAMASDALMQPESQAGFRRILHQGWTDAIRVRHPEGPVYTYWDYQAGAWRRDAGFRIDHLLLSPQAADRLVDAGVDRDYRGREKASDHAPTWAELERGQIGR
jgi:exodeoxyribonuclease III